MLTLVREALREQLAQAVVLAELHASGDPRLLDQVGEWLARGEKKMQDLRRTEAASLAAVRARFGAGREGQRDPEISADLSPRKALRTLAALAIGRGEQTLRESLAAIDARLQPLQAQMVQLVSAAHLFGLVGSAPEESHEAWLRALWGRLGSHEKTRGMHTYLSAALPLIDRLYLLDEVVGNLMSQPEQLSSHGLVS